MKLFRSKSLSLQRKNLQAARVRVGKVTLEIRELSNRDWRGGELEISKEVNSTRKLLEDAGKMLAQAENQLLQLVKLAEVRGK